jgi:hypothetical protein
MSTDPRKDYDLYVEDLQDRFFNVMNGYANLLVWLQLKHPTVYADFKRKGTDIYEPNN